MIICTAHNITSPLGNTSADNLRQVEAGHTALNIEGTAEEPLCLARLSQIPLIKGFTRFETLCIKSIKEALCHTCVNMQENDTVFILSSTKGNIGLIGQQDISLALSAGRIAAHFNNPNPPVTVSNACISGVSAQITAMRLLQAGLYRTAVITGADLLSSFVISGFQSFKALSPLPCRPFDKDRQGLNLGEAAATIVWQRIDDALVTQGQWKLCTGSIHNDANHISGPSRTAEGSYRCLRDVMQGRNPDTLAFVSTHGTGTVYNDEMEALALARANLQLVPVTALKGCYGHTLGAAGIVETILGICAIDNRTVLGSRGYALQGTTSPVNIHPNNRPTGKTAFIKMLSGFGGCNAAILLEKQS